MPSRTEIQYIEHNASRGALWFASDYVLLAACFACAFGILSPFHDVELFSMIAVPAITVAVLAFRGIYRMTVDQRMPYMFKRLGSACVLAVLIWIPVFSVYAEEHTPWSAVPVYLLLAITVTAVARKLTKS